MSLSKYGDDAKLKKLAEAMQENISIFGMLESDRQVRMSMVAMPPINPSASLCAYSLHSNMVSSIHFPDIPTIPPPLLNYNAEDWLVLGRRLKPFHIDIDWLGLKNDKFDTVLSKEKTSALDIDKLDYLKRVYKIINQNEEKK